MPAGNAGNKCATAFYLLISLECGGKGFKPQFSILALKIDIYLFKLPSFYSNSLILKVYLLLYKTTSIIYHRQKLNCGEGLLVMSRGEHVLQWPLSRTANP